MSMAPNNPFDSNQNPNQYGYQQQPSQGSNVWLWVLGTIGGMFLLGCLVCCGGGYFLFNKAKTEFDAEFENQVTERFGEDPNFKENIGEVQSVETNFAAIFTEAQKAEKENSNEVPMMIMDVEGDKGKGRLIYKANQEDGSEHVILVMEDGKEFELEDSSEGADSFAEMTEALQELEMEETASESEDVGSEGSVDETSQSGDESAGNTDVNELNESSETVSNESAPPEN